MKKFYIIVFIVVVLALFFINNMHQVRLHLFLGQYVQMRLSFLILIIFLASLSGYFLMNAYLSGKKDKRKNKDLSEPEI
jgi:uncharacterized integral membrane protein